MSEEQLSALIAKLKEDAGLKEKLQGAGTLDAAVEIAKEAGCDVCKADFIRLQANQMLALSDDEIEELSEDQLEAVAGGFAFIHAIAITPPLIDATIRYCRG
jgi:predicted ribosomally synthesized peptide with nif11-like leader